MLQTYDKKIILYIILMKNENYESYFDNILINMLEGVAIHQLIFNDNNIPIDYTIIKVNDSYKKILGM